MRVTYMISLNHDVPAQSITKLHAYKFAANPRNPAQTRTFPRNATRKFGLTDADNEIGRPRSMASGKWWRAMTAQPHGFSNFVVSKPYLTSGPTGRALRQRGGRR